MLSRAAEQPKAAVLLRAAKQPKAAELHCVAGGLGADVLGQAVKMGWAGLWAGSCGLGWVGSSLCLIDPNVVLSPTEAPEGTSEGGGYVSVGVGLMGAGHASMGRGDPCL